MHRRKFVGAVTALAAIGKAASAQQAGKEPQVSDWMYRTQQQWGPQYYDEKEREQLIDVLDKHLPFRFYGSRPTDRPEKVATFEKEFAARMQSKYALAVNSGTSALEAAVTALGVGPGDEVIVPAWTWHSDATAVIRAGALPVFAEIDESFNIDPADIESRIAPFEESRQDFFRIMGHPAENVRQGEGHPGRAGMLGHFSLPHLYSRGPRLSIFQGVPPCPIGRCAMRGTWAYRWLTKPMGKGGGVLAEGATGMPMLNSCQYSALTFPPGLW